jgi:hypothetical protein
MKSKVAILVMLVNCVLPAAEISTNLLSIHLVDTPLFHQWPSNGRGGATLKVICQPVLADSDFVEFDASNHTFAITADASKRLSKTIWDLAKRDAPGWNRSPTLLKDGFYELVPADAPFVLEAAGEPVYFGAFSSMNSSRLFFGPVAISDVEFISTGLKTNITFRVFFRFPTDRAPDEQSDLRIALAAKKLFAHEAH